MESIVTILHSNNHAIKDCIDLTRLNNKALRRVCDLSKLSSVELVHLLDCNDYKKIQLLESLVLDESIDLRSIEFEKFSDAMLQDLVGFMLFKNLSTDVVCIVLDRMRSVNYGTYTSLANRNTNPLIHCCVTNKFDLVKLLVDRYGADIEHPSYSNSTAIMYSAEKGDAVITKYLYDKGARLNTATHDIDNLATDLIKKLFSEWTATKIMAERHKSVYHEIKYDYQKLQSRAISG